MDKVLQNLQSEVRDMLQMRLVCKGWKNACSEFAGMADIIVHRNIELVGICRTLPGLRELQLYNEIDNIYLPALSSLSRLSSLRVEYIEDSYIDHSFDLLVLPSRLRALELECCSVDSSCYPNISCTGLTRLAFHWTENTSSEVAALLQHLPLLQVKHCSKLCWSAILSLSSKIKSTFRILCWQAVRYLLH